MSFGNILGQFLQQGAGGSQTRSRLDTSARNLETGGAVGGGGAGGIFAQLQGALGGGAGGGGAGAGQAFGGLAEKAKQFLGQEQVGGMSGAQLGGIGAVAGALLGGGVGGAARGGALAVLGTLALTALKNAQAQRGAAPQANGETVTLEPQEIAAVTGPETERLLLRAMISAAKADGQIDQTEMQTIIGKVDADGVTADEKAFVMDEMRAPVDVAALAAEARHPAQAAEVYAASLLAIDIDTETERQYLRDLAAALRLDAATVAQLHQMTGAPKV